MYSQKNNLKVFVSSFATPNLDTVIGIDALPVGQIAFFDGVTDLIDDPATSGFGYFAWNKGGTIHRTKKFAFNGFTANPVLAYAAPTAAAKTIAIPAPLADSQYFQLRVEIKAENNNGDIVLFGVAKSAAGDSQITITAKLFASLNSAISRLSSGLVSAVNDGAGNITVTGGRHQYSQGRKVGRQVNFSMGLSYPEELNGQVTIDAVANEGIGHGEFINLKETFAIGNSDSVSRNEFATAQPLVLASSPSGKYNVLSVQMNLFDEDNSAAVAPIPQQVILAFDSTGADAPVATP